MDFFISKRSIAIYTDNFIQNQPALESWEQLFHDMARDTKDRVRSAASFLTSVRARHTANEFYVPLRSEFHAARLSLSKAGFRFYWVKDYGKEKKREKKIYKNNRKLYKNIYIYKY